MQARPIVALLAAGFVVGCAPTAPTAVPTPAPTATAVAATITPTLPAGRATFYGFEPPITLELDASWESVTLVDGFFDLRYVPDPGLALVQVTLVESVLSGDPSVVTPTTPKTAAEAVSSTRQNTYVDVIETSDSRMGGLEGEQITIERPTPGGSLIPGWQVLGTPAGELSLGPGWRYWMAFFDAPQGLVAVLVLGPTDRWEAALLAAEPVLETISFVTP